MGTLVGYLNPDNPLECPVSGILIEIFPFTEQQELPIPLGCFCKLGYAKMDGFYIYYCSTFLMEYCQIAFKLGTVAKAGKKSTSLDKSGKRTSDILKATSQLEF